MDYATAKRQNVPIDHKRNIKNIEHNIQDVHF